MKRSFVRYVLFAAAIVLGACDESGPGGPSNAGGSTPASDGGTRIDAGDIGESTGAGW
jgi:hypothetical protein